MHKPAPVAHPVHEIVQARFSPRGFSDRQVDAETLASLFEAARWAPSSFNEQPWGFVFAGRADAEAFNRILDLLTPGNQSWAHTAAALMISVARSNFERNGKPNRHAFHDVGLASGAMAFQAAAMGMGVHMMAGFDAARAKSELKIPDGFEPVAAIAIGYPESPERMPDEMREKALKPRSRKPIAEFVFAGQWGGTPRGIS
ncbi:MAG TPA: nitroreductase family protein [Alphaproteobacteria bacterium]|jgi:nitroreductase|nr:nitroreductase family protein [Alphaproteobacteria bacterium]